MTLPAGRRACGFGVTVGSEHASGKGEVQVIRSLSKVQIRQPIPASLSLYLIQIGLTSAVGSGFSSVQKHPFGPFLFPSSPVPIIIASQPGVVSTMVKSLTELVTSKPPTANEDARANMGMAMLGLLGGAPRLVAFGGV